MDLEQQLRAALAPCNPGPQLRAAVNARLSAARATRRRPVRPLLLGILLVASAAAMLAIQRRDPLPQTTVVITPPEQAPRAAAVDKVEADAIPLPASVESPAAPPAAIVVLLESLDEQTEDPEVRSTLRAFYDELASGLRAMPGLMVLQSVPGDSPGRHVDFHIAVYGSGGNLMTSLDERKRPALQAPVRATPGKWQAGLRIQATGKPSRFSFIITGGNLPSMCAGSAKSLESGDCRSPASLAQALLDQLHLQFLPNDKKFRNGLRAAVLDGTRSFSRRFAALELLSRQTPGDIDTSLIRAALELIDRSPGAHASERLLEMLRGHTDPVLLGALIDMAYQHPEDSVRARALSMLIDEYESSASARTAIQSLAAGDRMPLLSRVAERAITGDDKWNEYVLATLMDASLSPAQRFAPMAYLMQTRQQEDLRKLLDSEAISALKDVLPRVVGSEDESAALSALGVMALVPDEAHQEAIDLMLAVWNGASAARYRVFAIDPLLRHVNDSRVRGKLEQIAATETDPQLRDRISAALTESGPTK